MNFETLVDKVWDVAENNPNGFTISLNFEMPKKGFVVAYKETQNSFGKEGLERCLKHSIQNKGFVGGWRNQKNQLQFDSVAIIDDINEAIDLGRAQNQISIWYLNKGCEIIM